MRIQRHNIYSCTTIQCDGIEVCCDPAKIAQEDLDQMNPDLILISHESMDHMDPMQTYLLQKKKLCTIFCSIAVAVDLAHHFPQDTDFIDSLWVMMPGCEATKVEVQIRAEKSIHCDYMLPLIFSLRFPSGSLLHCFDSHLSNEMIALSKESTIAIIPIGIAQGISPTKSLEFVQKLHSPLFVTNHCKPDALEQLESSSQLIALDWNEARTIPLSPSPYFQRYSPPSLLMRFNEERGRFLEQRHDLFASYSQKTEPQKIELLVFSTALVLIDPLLIDAEFLMKVERDAITPVAPCNNNLNTVALLFLAVYGKTSVQKILPLIGSWDHLNYWVVEFLGRMALTPSRDAIDGLMRIIAQTELYQSVVVRRKLFWEIHRIAREKPCLTMPFLPTIEEGLDDANPDVRLLALLCLKLIHRIAPMTKAQANKIVTKFPDPEEDVRETAMNVAKVCSI